MIGRRRHRARSGNNGKVVAAAQEPSTTRPIAPGLLFFLTLFVPLLLVIVAHRGGDYLVRLFGLEAQDAHWLSPGLIVRRVEGDPRLAEKARDRVSDASELARLRRMLVMAIEREPLNARAFRLLGQIAELQGDRPAAKRAMKMAARLSSDESYALDWMMRESLNEKAYPEAADYADILLRTQRRLVSEVTPFLTRLAESSEGRQAILTVLRDNPPWRPAFFNALADAASGQTMFDLLTGLKGGAAPPTTSEVNAFVALLAQNKRYDDAYRAWMLFLPSDHTEAAGYLFNGNFQLTPDGSLFDWRLPKAKGASARIEELDGDQRALFLRLGPGRVEGAAAGQITVLPPGAYRFSGSFRGEVSGPRGMEWAVRCIQSPRPLGASEPLSGVVEDWRSFEFEFVVPDKNCPALSVAVAAAARSPSEQLVSGKIWFDDLAIERVSDD